MEPLGRGVMALRSSTTQAYIGWRLFATDPADIGFNIYRSANGAAGVKLNTAVITTTTDFVDTTANFAVSNAWYVRPILGGIEQAPSAPFGLAANHPVRQYLSIPLQPVIGGANPPYDVKFAWFGDFDGDGEYDYLVDRLSTTANVKQYLQAYKRDGTFLWQIDMGPNSMNTSGSSTIVYEPSSSAISVGDKDNVTVYDLDGDGKAEVMVRTSNGTIFGDGHVQAGGATEDVQFLSIVDGLTGGEKARATIPNPYLADGPLNMHAGVAYLDGIRPSIIFSGENRVGTGPFQRLTVAWDYRNGVLTQRWLYQTPAQHNDSEGHQLRIADVNNDGKDDIVRIGSVVSDSNGVPVTLYSTELVHGDRYHIADIDPERPGLEMFAIQQNNPTLLATSLQDLGSGVLYRKWYSGSVADVGRGTTLDLTPSHRGYEMYSTQPGIFNAKGEQIYANNLWAPEALWWDADLLREFEDGAGSGAYSPVVNKFNPSTGTTYRLYTLYNEDGGVHQAYGGRAAVWGDLFGDWREEFMVVANDYNSVRIYTTKIPATNRIYCLMQNPMYRVQCTYRGYYQASYVDYYLGDDMPAIPVPPVSNAAFVWRGGASSTWDNSTANWFTNNLWISNTTAVPLPSGASVLFDASGTNTASITLSGPLTPSDVRIHSPQDYTFSGNGALTGGMNLTKAGAGTLTFTGTNPYTGITLISEGLFRVNGALPHSAITVRGGVWLNGRLGGTGTVGGTVRFEEGAGFSPGAGANSPGTLTITNHVTLTGRTLSDFDLSDNPSGGNDLVAITGNLTLQGTNTLVIHKLNPTLPPGVYPLITYSGALNGSLNNLAIAGLQGLPYTLTNPPNQIALLIIPTRAPAVLTWTGGQNGNAWNLVTTSNWLNGAIKDWFVPGDTVQFDSVGTSNPVVNLTGYLNAGGVVVNSAANYTLTGSGVLMGTGGLTKSGPGTLTINANNNTYTGATTVSGGTLVVPELDAIGAASPLGNPPGGSSGLVLSGGSTLRITGESYTDRGLTIGAGVNSIEVFNAADQVTLAGKIIGSGTLQKNGSGTLALSENNDHTGGTIIKAGTISLGGDVANADAFGSGLVTLDGGTINMFSDSGSYNSCSWNLYIPPGSAGTLNADSRVDMYGSLTGAGTLNFFVPYVRTTLFGNWSGFTGLINVTTDGDGGDFRINNSSGYANASIIFGNNVYAYRNGGGSTTIGAVSGSSSATMNGTTWTVGTKNTDATFAGVISGNSVIVKTGSGTWYLTGTSTYTGSTTVSAGTLMVNGDNSDATGNVTVNTAGTLAGTGIVGGNTTVSGTLAPGSGGIGTLNFSGTLGFNGSSKAFMEINKSSGTKDLANVTGALTYGGTLQVTNLSGTLTSGDSYKLFNAASYGGAFTSYNLPLLNAGLAWDTSDLATSGIISVVISNAPGPKMLVWKGDGAGNFWDTNTTTNWRDTNNAPAYFNDFDTVTFNDEGSNNSPVLLTGPLQPAALTVNATKNYTFAGPGEITGTNSLTKSGSGTLSIATSNSYSGATVVNAGTLQLTSLNLNLTHRWTFNGTLLNSVSSKHATVVNVGANNVILSGSEITMTGGPQDLSNYVDLGDDILPNDTTPVTIELWATPISVQNWSRIFDFGSATTENVFMSWTRGTTTTQDRVEWVDSGTINTADDTCQPYSPGTEYHIAMVIQPGAGAGGTTRVTWYRAAANDALLGAARGTFDTANTLANLNDVNCWLGRSQWPDNTANASYNECRIWHRALSAAELQLLHTAGADTDLTTSGLAGMGALPANTPVDLAGATAKLENASGQPRSIGSLTGVAGSEVKLTSGGLAVGGDNTSTTFAGVFSGLNGLTKTGGGTLTLTGNSTHGGSTTVSAGSLVVHGNLTAAVGPITVNSGATLGGNGTFGGATTIASGATLSPGAGIGALTFNSALTLSGTTVMEISSAPLTNDIINKNSVLTYGGHLVVINVSGPLSAGDTFPLFNAPAYAGSFSSLTLPSLAANLAWNTNLLNSAGVIAVESTAPTTPPTFGSATFSANSLILSGSNGMPNASYYLLSSTNIALPMWNWIRIATNQFDGNGTFNVTNPVNPATPRQFYRLQLP